MTWLHWFNFTLIERGHLWFTFWNMDLFQSTLKTVEKVLKDDKITKIDIAHLLIIGGRKIINVKEIVENFFEMKGLTGFETDDASVMINNGY